MLGRNECLLATWRLKLAFDMSVFLINFNGLMYFSERVDAEAMEVVNSG